MNYINQTDPKILIDIINTSPVYELHEISCRINKFKIGQKLANFLFVF